MARQARDKNDYGTYYIHQSGGSNQEVFRNNEDRDRFLLILNRTQQKYKFKLYAYCLLKTNEYHLVLNIDGGDISKVMKSINISYAMYAATEGKLFKDRYKSELLNSEAELNELIKKIHERNEGATAYNSYCVFSGLAPLEIAFPNQIKQISEEQECKDCIKTLAEAQNKISELAISENLTYNELIKDKTRRNDLIKKLRSNSTLTLKELGELFGGLSESTVCKILNQC
jgi:putative transposase